MLQEHRQFTNSRDNRLKAIFWVIRVWLIQLKLIHWPNPKALRENDAWKVGNADAWKAMEEAYKDGKVRAIGVSNFMQHHLDALLETAEIVPHVNQILLAPGCAQEDLVAYCQERELYG